MLAKEQLRLSIALCTYNGERFLQQQLASITQQTRLPDELVVGEDGSMDSTLVILENFARSAPFPVRVQKNPCNLGSTKNFEETIRRCEGDIIALCDQDDFWIPCKLERLEATFLRDRSVGLVFSDGIIVDERSRPVGQKMWRNCPFTPALQRQFNAGGGPEILLRYNCVTGAAMAFRADLRRFLLPIATEWLHDYWIAFIASAVADAVAIPEPLIWYHRHEAQQIGLKALTLPYQLSAARKMDHAYFAKRVRCFESLTEHLSGIREHLRDAALLQTLHTKVAHSRVQAHMRQCTRWRRALLALRELAGGKYQSFGRGFKSFFVDAFL
ncbi:MAG: glycosyltransferase family 2 protein [Gemmataceae bacterium]|nr:glycosyltransferase family 2 protein [Gemmataceae bacterium]